MLCAMYANVQSYYGNIQLGFYNPPTYTWGAWSIPDHYQPPLTEKEERIVEERRGQVPEPLKTPPKADNEAIILRLQHTARMQEIASYKYETVKRTDKPSRRHTDDEDFFILM